MQVQVPNAIAAADLSAKRMLVAVAFYVAARNRVQVQPESAPTRRLPVPDPAPTAPTVVPAATSPWACIAEAETGTDWSMTGSVYSTAFGMINDIIYDYGTPEEQTAVFSGTASPEQQIDIASRFAADHGFGGWGVLTKQKCGLS